MRILVETYETVCGTSFSATDGSLECEKFARLAFAFLFAVDDGLYTVVLVTETALTGRVEYL